MSSTLTMVGKTFELISEFNPPLMLDGNYECGLLYFATFNAIPNVHEGNNIFVYGRNNIIKIPNGAYDFFDIFEYLKSTIKGCQLILKPNTNTLKCHVFCTESLNFGVENSVGSLLGFSKRILEPNKWHDSDNSVSILPVSVIQIECDLIQGSYTNGIPTHIIHEFVQNTPAGQQLIEVPKNIIYFPISKNHISSVIVKVLNLEGKQIDFKDESIQLCLHIRKAK